MDDIVAGVFDQILEGNHVSVDTLFVQQIEIDIGDDDLFLVDGAVGCDSVPGKEIIRGDENGGLTIVYCYIWNES